MIKTENILWLTDFSEDSAYALVHARTLAELFHTKLYLMHVIVNADSRIYGRVPGDYWAMEANAKEKAQEYMQACVRKTLDGFAPYEVIICQSEILEEVLAAVARKHIGTIVMSSYGRTGLSHFLLGSVTEKVIRSVQCPVYVVRHPERVMQSAYAAQEQTPALPVGPTPTH